jgi:ferritin
VRCPALGWLCAIFSPQSGEERQHATRILQHLADREVVPQIGALTAPRTNFADLIECAQAVFDLERANTRGIHAAYADALKHEDYPAQVMLHWFIAEQVEEEAWSDKMLAKTRQASCAGALQYLDHHLEKELAGPGSDQ